MQISKLVDKIKDYRDSSYTPYAILINGKWGSGKTYFFKNVFQNHFTENVIYVSVNGVSSTKDLAKEIIFRKYFKKDDRGRIKKIFNISRKVGTGIINHYSDGAIDSDQMLEQALEMIELTRNDFLIIDDLERIVSPLTYESLFGFISRNFLEKKDIKVLLIGNEEFINDEKISSSYKKIKEKIIWQTYKYEIHFEEIFESLTSNFKRISASLNLRKEIYIEIFRKLKITNLRSVLFFLSVLEYIDLKLDESIFDISGFDRLFKSILILCNEYKDGKLNENLANLNYLKTENPTIFMDDYSSEDIFKIQIKKLDNGISNEQNIREKELIKYFSDRYLFGQVVKYKFFQSILDYLVNGDLDFSLLKNEISRLKNECLDVSKESLLVASFANIANLEMEAFVSNWKEVILLLRLKNFNIDQIESLISIYANYVKYLDFPKTDEFEEVCLDNIRVAENGNSHYSKNHFFDKRNVLEKLPILKKLLTELDNRKKIILSKAHQEDLLLVLKMIKANEKLNLVLLGNFFEFANNDQIQNLADIVLLNASKTSKFSNQFYQAKKEFQLHNSSQIFRSNMEFFLKLLKAKITPKSTQFVSFVGIERVVKEYVLY